MSFEWLERTPPRKNGAQLRAQVEVAELALRAGLLYRLGFSQAQATARLVARIAWEFEAPTKRPDALSDQAIGKIVADTYARKPG